MYEWKIVNHDGHYSIIYAERWKKEDNGNGKDVFNFYQDDFIAKQFSIDKVKTIQKTWPEVGVIYTNETSSTSTRI